jgi:hypothetical protein
MARGGEPDGRPGGVSEESGNGTDQGTPGRRHRFVRVRRNDLASRRADDEVVVLDLRDSSYRALNATGALLWERMADWASMEDLTALLVDAFGLDATEARRDILRFVEECEKGGLLEGSEGP